MTPTLAGRLQTRIVMLGTVGVLWTLLIGLVVPGTGDASLGTVYRALFTALAVVAVVGMVWELLYHLAQQLRWEKDWPTLVGLVVAIPEGVVAWLVLQAGLPWDIRPVAASTFLTMFVSVWVLVWAITNGPLQIVAPRWRYRGGRFFGGW